MHAVAGEHAAQEEGGLANVPTGHVAAVYAQVAEPWGLKAPPAQGVQFAADVAPDDAELVPAGQGDATPAAQKNPGGHSATPLLPQTLPGGTATPATAVMASMKVV